MENVTDKITQELANKVDSYLSGKITHNEIKDYAWSLTDNAPDNPKQNEKTYWSTVFTIIHLADDEHWNDGCTQKDLGELLKLLQNDH